MLLPRMILKQTFPLFSLRPTQLLGLDNFYSTFSKVNRVLRAGGERKESEPWRPTLLGRTWHLNSQTFLLHMNVYIYVC